MASVRTWLLSLAAAGGVAGGGVAGLTASSAPATADPKPQPGVRHNVAYLATLQQQVASLLAEDRALHTALAQARRRLAGQIRSREAALAVLQQRLVSTQAALRTERAALQATSTGAATPAARPSSRPTTHTTTGASGTKAGSGEGPDD